jgi:outer membrane receptor protein involved in Fe transport
LARAQKAEVARTVTTDAAPIVLSPFAVTAESDNGYAATETLAGTRLRTNLKDVASSMSVLTSDFLRDLSATTLEDAMGFLPSTNVLQYSYSNLPGQQGAFDGYNLRFGNGQNFSIRGVSPLGGTGANVASDFFNTQAPNDFYNTESTTVSRGPNSILFGTGGASGSVITSTKRATLTATKTQTSVATDRWGSDRETLDHNQVIVKGRLALRLNALNEDRNEFRSREGQWQKRISFALTAKPSKDTTVSVLQEIWRFDRNQVPLTPWFSNGLLNWVASGRPTVDFVGAGKAWSSAGRTFVDASGKPVPVAAGVATSDGLIHAQKDFDPKNILTQNAGVSNYYLAGLGLNNPLWNLQYQPVIKMTPLTAFLQEQATEEPLILRAFLLMCLFPPPPTSASAPGNIRSMNLGVIGRSSSSSIR